MNLNLLQKLRKLLQISTLVLLLIGIFNPDGAMPAGADVGAPLSLPVAIDGFDDTAFDVHPDIDMITGWEWPPDTEVTIEVPAYSYTTTATSDSEGDVDLPPLPVDLQVGHVVTLSDGVTTKTTTVVPLEFTSYSLSEGTVTGTAEPFSAIWGFTCNGISGDCDDEETTANKNGIWTLDYSAIGIDPGSDGGVYRWDEDGDATSFMWRVPHFSVIPNEEVVHGVNWNPYDSIDVFVDGTYVKTEACDEEGHVEIHDLAVRPDQKVKLTDGMYTKVHTVRPLKLTSVDPQTDKVKGTADPGSIVMVLAMEAWDEEPAASITTTAKTDGTWVAKFFNVGWDIVFASFGIAEVCDKDGDCTGVFWEGPPDDIEPDYGEKLTTSKVTFDWLDEPGADLYKIQLSTREDFSTLVLSTKTGDSFYAFDVKLLYNTTYYWRIRPFYGDERGEWFPIWKFFSMDPLTSPVLISPANKELVTTSEPTFTWQPVENAAAYLIQLSTSSLFDTSFLKTTVGSTELSEETIPDGKYYWRVRAIDASGGKGPWSEVRIVKVDAVP